MLRILLWLLISFEICAQPTFRFERWTIDDGLSQNSVWAITKDHQGYMWFATDDGLNRFDGYDFKVYRPQPNNPHSISSNDISSLYVDHSGAIWVGTRSTGLNRFDVKTERFIHYPHEELNSNSLSHERVEQIIGDGDRGIWVATSNGLNHFDTVSKTFTRYFHQSANLDSLSHNDIRDLHVDRFGRLWVATYGGGINLWQSQSQSFIRFNSKSGPSFKSLANVTSVTTSDERLWFGTTKGLFSVDLSSIDMSQRTWQIKQYQQDIYHADSLTNYSVSDLIVDDQQRLWIATFGGGLCVMQAQQHFVCYISDINNRFSIGNNYLWSLYLDDQQGLWIGVQSGGVNKINLVASGFGHVFNNNRLDNALSDNRVWVFLQDQGGDFWVGTEGGINRFVDGEVKYYRNNPMDNTSLSHDFVHDMAFHEQTLWVATHQGFNRMDVEQGTFEVIPMAGIWNMGHSANDLSEIIITDRGRMWLGTSGSGMFYFDPTEEVFIQYRHIVNNRNSISGNFITQIIEDKNDNLWISTRAGGLNYYNIQTSQFTHYRYDSKDKHSLSSDFATILLLHSNGDLWVGTNSGLNRMVGKTGKFERFGREHGLANGMIRGIVEDELGNLWVSTNLGLSYFNTKQHTFVNYDVHDGLQSNEFKPKSFYKSPKGEIFFGGVNGYNHFYTKDIWIDKIPPKIVFTDFLVANRSIAIEPTSNKTSKAFTLPVSINFLPELVVNHKQNLITVEFAGLHFINPLKNQYAYRLLGFDDESWISTDIKNRRATYSNLPAGDYVLEVKASNRDGFWTPTPKRLAITVLPPPWRSWWAYLGYFCIGMAPVFVYLRAQRREMQYKREQNIKLEQTVAKRTAQLERRNQQIEQQNREIIEAQHHLVQSEKMASLGTLTAGVAHEVNNPNNFVYVSAQNLSRNIAKAQDFFIALAGDELDEELRQAFIAQFEPLRDNIDTIKDGSERIQLIVKDLRTFTQLDKAELNQVVITDLVKATVNLAKAQYLKLIEFDCQFAHEPKVLCYPAQLNQVFMNLIVNACQAIEANINQQKTFQKGNLTIMSYVIGDELIIEFIDSGCGFDVALKEKLCEPFYTTKSVGAGTGLGLSISYGIIQKHNGRLLINSIVGIGSTFKVVLPLVS